MGRKEIFSVLKVPRLSPFFLLVEVHLRDEK
jgi:hypothetical protein